MSRIDDILSNAALREEPDVIDEREPKDQFHYVFMCEMMIDENDMHQYSRALCHIMNQHMIIEDYEIVKRPPYTARYDNITYTTEEIGYIPGFSIFFNLNEDEKTMDNVWNLVWSISCYNNGLLLHNHSVWKNNWKEDAEKEFNSMYGEDILNTSDISKLLNVFWPRMMFYTKDLEDLIFQTKNRREIMEFRGFHRVRLDGQWYNTKKELTISGRDALEIQEKWWFVKKVTIEYMKHPLWPVLIENFEKLLYYLTHQGDGSYKRCKLESEKKMQRFIDTELELEELEGDESLPIGIIRFTDKITIDDDGNIIRL